MPKIRWEDLGDIKHNILGSLQKVSLIESKAEELVVAAISLRKEIIAEVDKYNDIISRVPDEEKGSCEVGTERRKK